MKTALLTDSEVTEQLAKTPEWNLADKAITRNLVFNNFREAVAFLVLIAFDAEEADHHPDVTLRYKRLTLSLSTHSEGGLTQKDFALAGKINAAREAFGNKLP